MSDTGKYEVVIGLEVHAQLMTKTKLFCGDSIAYGASPNTQVSPITLGHPGTLPKMNRQAVEFAVRMGLACHSAITRNNYFVRKHYFYPDLPKGYQVSQHTTPICAGGYVNINSNRVKKKIQLNRIHLEEDAGKSLHDAALPFTSIDYNRAGTPLIEIVTEPDLRSADEAFSFLFEIRKLVRYLGICDGNMEQGSLRCDANISVRLKGDEKLGTRVEVKNLNSMRNVKKAIEIETKRLIELLEKGEEIVQQTLSFDADNNITFSIRDKEDADDYRYFAEPDLTPFSLGEDFLERIAGELPVLQEERSLRYSKEWNLSSYDADLLTEERTFSDYFEEVVSSAVSKAEDKTRQAKSAANWMLGPVRSWLNEENKDISAFPVSPAHLSAIIGLVDEGKLSFSTASGRLLPRMINDPSKSAEQIALEENLLQQSDVSDIEPVIDAVLASLPDKVREYKKGKKGLLALFVGEVMKRSKGKADPRVTNDLLIKKLQA